MLKMFEIDINHQCNDRKRAKSLRLIHCFYPSHKKKQRCNVPGRFVSFDSVHQIFSSSMVRTDGLEKISICDACNIERLSKLNSAEKQNLSHSKLSRDATSAIKEGNLILNNEKNGIGIFEDSSTTVIVMGRTSKLFKDSSRNTRRKKVDIIGSLIESVGMTLSEAACAILKKAMDENPSHDFSSLRSTLGPRNISRLGFEVPMSAKHSSALILYHGLSDNVVRFIRSYLGSIPPIEEIRKEKWKFVLSMPTVFGLNSITRKWSVLGQGRFTIDSKVSRTIECVRMRLGESIKSRLKELKEIGKWPYPPSSPFISPRSLRNSVIVLLSVDSGTGTVKFMFKFMTTNNSQRVNEIVLFAQARGVSENFNSLKNTFMPISDEIKSLEREGVSIDGKRIDVKFMFVGDFKILYAVTGSFGASSRYSCIWCRTPSALMDRTFAELKDIAISERKHRDFTTKHLLERPDVLDLRSKAAIPGIQKSNTFNFLHLESGGGDLRLPSNIVPPVLHIHLGIINKIVKAFDSIVALWNSKNQYNRFNSTPSPADKLLAYALSRCGARRETYYAGSLSGVPCSNLMRKMNTFIALFFCRKAESWGEVTEAIPSTLRLKRDLQVISGLYTGSSRPNRRGIEFYLKTKQKWTAGMLSDWEILVRDFVQIYRSAIGRKRANPNAICTERERWLQPLFMPKLHTLSVHCTEFIMQHDYLGAYSEESF